jgi:hypothetical protein
MFRGMLRAIVVAAVVALALPAVQSPVGERVFIYP